MVMMMAMVERREANKQSVNYGRGRRRASFALSLLPPVFFLWVMNRGGRRRKDAELRRACEKHV